MDYTLELTDELEILEESSWDIGDALTLELADELEISIGSFIRAGNNMKLTFEESIEITAVLTSAYFIRRAADTAFARTNYP